MRPFLHLTCVALLLCVPIGAEAKQATTFDFSQNFAQQGWQAHTNLQMALQTEGVRLQLGNHEAALRKDVNFDHGVDVMEIRYSSPKNNQVRVLWDARTDGKDETYMAPLTLPASDTPTTTSVNLALYDEWDQDPASVGLLLMPGTDLIIHSISFTGWNSLEKLAELGKGFWQFDIMRPYSINFLWGPRLSTNPVATKYMFSTPSPTTPSANSVLYAVLAVGLGAFWAMKRFGKWSPKRAIAASVWLFGGIWLLYDVRMGAEILSYVYKDYQSYYSQPVGVRTFRERRFFADFAEAVAPFVANREKYIFVSDYKWPYVGLIRYYTYPSIPTHPFEGNAETYDTWLVYNRPDIHMNKNGQLLYEGQIASPPGQVLHEFDTGTFIFRTNE